MPRTKEEKREAKRASLQRWREKNRVKTRAWDRVYRSEHLEQAREEDRAEYQRHRDDRREKSRDRQRSRRSHSKDLTTRAWKEKHKEHIKAYNAAYMQKWRIENADKLKRYWEEHREEVRVRVKLRASRKKAASGSYTPADIRALFLVQKGLCAYFSVCGNKLIADGKGKFHTDHINPLCPKDKNRIPGSNDPSNLQLLCPACNNRKRNQDPYKFTQEHEGRLFPDLPQVGLKASQRQRSI